MTIRKTIIVLDEEFKTKKSLDNRIRKIRDNYEDDEPIDQRDFAFMYALLKRHQQAATKIGNGVVSIFVRRNSVFKKNREFWLKREDGTETDFSFKMCITPETAMQKFKATCRAVVVDEIVRFKTDFFLENKQPVCPIRKTLMTIGDSHVDHVPPLTFDSIVCSFLKDNNINAEDVEIISTMDGQILNRFADEEIRSAFIYYHASKANLRVVSAEANLSDIRVQHNQ